MSNVDLEINLDEDIKEKLVELYIRNNMESGSYEVFEREQKAGTSILEAAGSALMNDAIIVAMKLGMEADKKFDLDEDGGHSAEITITINGSKHTYPAGYVISYEEIATISESQQPSVALSSPRGDRIMRPGQVVDIEEGMIINAYDTNDA